MYVGDSKRSRRFLSSATTPVDSSHILLESLKDSQRVSVRVEAPLVTVEGCNSKQLTHFIFI